MRKENKEESELQTLLLAEEKEDKLRERLLTHAGFAYSVLAVLPVVLSLFVVAIVSASLGEGYAESNLYRYLCYLIPQICALVVAGIYFFRCKLPLKTFYKSTHPKYFLVALVLQFGLTFSVSYLNNGISWLLYKIGYESSGVALPDFDGIKILPVLFVIAVLPAFFEETVFRGILSSNLRQAGWGTVETVLISGALFSLFHCNPEQTAYQFVCGMAFALVACRSGSILPTMVAHFLNNAVILLLSYFFNPIYGASWTMMDVMPLWLFITLTVVSLLAFSGAAYYLLVRDRQEGERGMVMGKTFLFSAVIGILVCGVEWLTTLISGFYHG